MRLTSASLKLTMDFSENIGFVSKYGLQLSDLNVDEAFFNLTSTIYNNLGVYSLSSDCIRCPFTYVTNLNASKVITVSTKHPSTWRFYNESQSMLIKPVSDRESLVCEFNESIQEFGIYDISIIKDNYEFTVQKEPANIYLPLCATFVSLLLLHLFVKLGWNLSEKCFSRKRRAVDDIEIDDDQPTQKIRIRTIDAFRGFALCFMIFVNDGGGQYWFFNHSTWDGLYPADLLFPWFLWIMGVCIALSQTSLRKKMVRKRTIFKNILQRTFILFVIGLSLNTLGMGPTKIENLRIPGVLQRIAICYGITSIIAMLVFDVNTKWLESVKYIIMILPQWFFHLFILTGHIYLTFYFPVSGCPLGYLGPGGVQDDGKYENCTGGTTGYVDKILLGEKRLWQNAPVRSVYHTSPFDPENILGCLTSVFGTFLGVQAGYMLIVHRKPMARIRHFIIWAILSSAIGFGLHFYHVAPINKSLWSLSYVFATTGLAFFVFAIFYFIIDYAHWWNGAPFVYPGMNSILVYVGHELCYQLFPWHWRVSDMNTHLVNLIENAWGVVLWIVITFCLYKKKIFVSV